MTKILRIDSSARDSGSISRLVGDHLEARLVAALPDPRIARRDLASAPLPHISNLTISGYYTPADRMTAELYNATALSDELIHELRSAEILILTAPMYNFSIPSALKAWIDQVVRIGHTFSYDGASFSGLLTGKRAYVVCAYGASGYAAGGPFSAANFVDPYLRFLLNFLGIEDVTFVAVEATTAGEATLAANVDAAKLAVDSILEAA
ncbi:FMN-dependent NADH-azoreductase [Rhizobium sp. C4]|uniref:FMN-dependent NADH-azoreductase n=1 Tax=Rhizobium sp. C4 TaxID=1349800 RepID=UPI001E50F8A0|nr:NAD(P)H-dependent oxidoreductase [Rhizobium sp. C4]MCD2174437.1 NAD(P)H-dependent oxidoreductase [Rhizobium sp. C4]